jgi:hypothetical protein
VGHALTYEVGSRRPRDAGDGVDLRDFAGVVAGTSTALPRLAIGGSQGGRVMSKKSRKLGLNIETIRTLTGAALDGAVGGAEAGCVGSCTPACGSNRPFGCNQSRRPLDCDGGPKSLNPRGCQSGIVCVNK